MRGGRIGFDGDVEIQVESFVYDFPASHIRPVDQSDRDTGMPRPACPADAVDVGGIGVGAFVVDDMADARDVNSSGSDVGCHQDTHGSGPEFFQGTFSGDLVQVAVDGRSRETAFL